MNHIKKILIILVLSLSFGTTAFAISNVTWTKNGTYEYPNYLADFVGIGTTTPNSQFAVQGTGALGTSQILNVASSTGKSAFAVLGNRQINIDNVRGVIADAANFNWFFGDCGTLTATGQFNTCVGRNALNVIAGGASNMAMGLGALGSDTSGGRNVAIGVNAVGSNVSGNDNVAIGDSAGVGVAANSYSRNTLIGAQAGRGVTTGTDNLFLGFQAASTTSSGSSNISLGSKTKLPSITGSNQLNIGNLIYGTGLNGEYDTVSTGNIGVGTTTPWARLSVNTNSLGTAPAFAVGSTTGGTNFLVTNSGKVGIGTTTPGYAFSVGSTFGVDSYGNLNFGFDPWFIYENNLRYLTFQNGSGAGNLDYRAASLMELRAPDRNGTSTDREATYTAEVPISPYTYSGPFDDYTDVQKIDHGCENYPTDNTCFTAIASNGTGTTTPYRISFWDQQVYSSVDKVPFHLWFDPSGAVAFGYASTTSNSANRYDPLVPFQVSSTTATTIFAIDSTPRTHLFQVQGNGNVGVGSTTPGSLLSIGGNTTGTNFYDNATTTKNGTGGYNITSGCYALNGVCISGGGGAGTNYFTNSGVNTYLSTGTRLGVGTTTPTIGATLDVQSDGVMPFRASSNLGVSLLEVENSGNVGISTTTPLGKLSVNLQAGDINVPAFIVSSTTGTGATVQLLSIAGTGAINTSSSLTTAGTVSIGGQLVITGQVGNTNISAVSASTNGTESILVGRNASAGNAAKTRLVFQNDSTSKQVELGINSSTFTAAGLAFADSAYLTAAAANTGPLVLGTLGAVPVVFGTNNQENMRLASGGNLGLGSTTPWARLSIAGASNSTTPLFSISTSTASATSTAFFIDSTGRVGIGTSTPGFNLVVQNGGEGNTLQLYDTDGNCTIDPDAGGLTTTCSSDQRLKTDIRNTGSALDWFKDITVRDYTVIASGKPMTGVIAQEIQKVHPEVVHDNGGTLGVELPNPWLFVKAIQELASHDTKQDQEIAELKAQIAELKNDNLAICRF